MQKGPQLLLEGAWNFGWFFSIVPSDSTGMAIVPLYYPITGSQLSPGRRYNVGWPQFPENKGFSCEPSAGSTPLVEKMSLKEESVWYTTAVITRFFLLYFLQGFPGGSEVKASACNVGDLGSIPGLGRSLGEGNGNPLQYSCLENPMQPGGLQSMVPQRDIQFSSHYLLKEAKLVDPQGNQP